MTGSYDYDDHGHAAEEVDDDPEDFYGDALATVTAQADPPPTTLLGHPSATATNLATGPASANGTAVPAGSNEKEQTSKPEQTAVTASEEQRKTESQRKAELLRAKLIAQRRNAPPKPGKPSYPTPEPAVSTNGQNSDNGAKSVKSIDKANTDNFTRAANSRDDLLDLETLLAEGQAAAEAKAASAINGLHPQLALRSQAAETPLRSPVTGPPQRLADSYYTDLAAWLDITGYHDVEFRSRKLRAYKERRALEEEAVRIQARLEALRQAEEVAPESFRSSTSYSTPVGHAAPPPLPATMPLENEMALAPATNKLVTPVNGLKRARSPEPFISDKAGRGREEAGYRIRGVNDSPETRPRALRRQSPPALERRVSYPDARRASLDLAQSRDPSLERRQSYYKHDSDGPPPPRHDQYPPREATRPPGRGNLGYHSTNRPAYGSSNTRDFYGGQPYRGSASLDFRKSSHSANSRRI